MKQKRNTTTRPQKVGRWHSFISLLLIVISRQSSTSALENHKPSRRQNVPLRARRLRVSLTEFYPDLHEREDTVHTKINSSTALSMGINSWAGGLFKGGKGGKKSKKSGKGGKGGKRGQGKGLSNNGKGKGLSSSATGENTGTLSAPPVASPVSPSTPSAAELIIPVRTIASPNEFNNKVVSTSPDLAEIPVVLSAYDLLYTIDTEMIPGQLEIDPVVEVTRSFVENFFQENLAFLQRVDTAKVESASASAVPFKIEYNSTAVFSHSVGIVPDQTELDELLVRAFSRESLEAYTAKLRQIVPEFRVTNVSMTKTNMILDAEEDSSNVKSKVFSTTVSSWDIEGVKAHVKNDPVTEKGASTTLSAVTGTVGAAAFALLFGGLFIIYKGKRAEFDAYSDKKVDKDNEITVAGETYMGSEATTAQNENKLNAAIKETIAPTTINKTLPDSHGTGNSGVCHSELGLDAVIQDRKIPGIRNEVTGDEQNASISRFFRAGGDQDGMSTVSSISDDASIGIPMKVGDLIKRFSAS